MHRKVKTLNLIQISLMIVLMSVCSWISIPSIIPFTMQTFSIFLTLLLLGGKNGLIAILVYLFMGGIGLPVFSNFSGGFWKLLGPTGGFLFGFIFIAIVYILFESKNLNSINKYIPLTLGLFICYVFGYLWFMKLYFASFSITSPLSVLVLPYIIPDLIKLALAITCKKLITNKIEIQK